MVLTSCSCNHDRSTHSPEWRRCAHSTAGRIPRRRSFNAGTTGSTDPVVRPCGHVQNTHRRTRNLDVAASFCNALCRQKLVLPHGVASPSTCRALARTCIPRASCGLSRPMRWRLARLRGVTGTVRLCHFGHSHSLKQEHSPEVVALIGIRITAKKKFVPRTVSNVQEWDIGFGSR